MKHLVPQEVLSFTKSKLTELYNFHNKFALAEPNLTAMASRLRLITRALITKDIGMTPFEFTKDFHPNMKHDAANILTQADRLAMDCYLQNP